MLGEFIVQTDTLGTIKSDDLQANWKDAIPPIRVFNRDYVQDNIFSFNQETITPIFYLGEESVEKQKAVELKSAEMAAQNESQRLKLLEKKNKEKDIDDLAVRGGKAVKDALLSAGNNPYNNWNKADCKKSLGIMIESKLPATHFTRDDEKKAELKAKFCGALKDKIVATTSPLPDLKPLRDGVAALLGTTITSQNLTQLQVKPDLSRWVEQGLEIHKAGKHDDCQFCLQKLPETRIQDLEGYFNDQGAVVD